MLNSVLWPCLCSCLSTGNSNRMENLFLHSTIGSCRIQSYLVTVKSNGRSTVQGPVVDVSTIGPWTVLSLSMPPLSIDFGMAEKGLERNIVLPGIEPRASHLRC